MNRTSMFLLCILLALGAGAPFCSSVSAGALPGDPAPDSPAGETLTLRRAVRLALQNNHQAAAAAHARRAAVWAQRQAKAQLLPSITLESGYTRLDEETVARANAFGREITMFLPDSTGALQPLTIEIPQTVFRNGYQTSISGQLLLLHPEVLNGVALAGAAASLSADQEEVALRSCVHQTLRSYLELLKARSLADLQEEHALQAKRNTEQAGRLFEVGRYAEADVLRWRVEEATQEALLAEARRGVRLAALALENLIGAEPLSAVDPDTTLPGRLLREIGRFRNMGEEDWTRWGEAPLEEVVRGNPQLRVLEETTRISELNRRQSLTAFLPSVTLAGSYGWQNNDTPELDGDRTWSLTAALRLPLFTSFANYSGYQAARSKVRQTRETTADAVRALYLSAEAARSGVQSAAVRLRQAETAVQSARRGYEIQQSRFALGRLSNLEWIDATLALRAAEQARVAAYYDLTLAIVDHFESTGGIYALVED